ncbi:MAG: carboxypeptidase regulatory-like domain-containing protein [Firmicutes bacterium]|nr:carboxypeptidase regulatory-like domain-containing protein [Bacillota bacterium]
MRSSLTGAKAVRVLLVLVLTVTAGAMLVRMHGFELQVKSLPVVQQTAGIVFELRNIFGDHVGGAEIVVAGRHKITTDEFGVASLSGVSAGDVGVSISAPGYREVSLNVHLSPGKNLVVFRNETALVPSGFAVDFHVYWNTVSGGLAKAIAEISLYNGTNVPVYVTECDVVYPGEASTLRLLDSEQAFVDFGVMSSVADVVSHPETALKIASGRVVQASPVVLPGTPKDGEMYTLRLVSTHDLSIPRDQRNIVTLVDEMDYDGDWDPHVP